MRKLIIILGVPVDDLNLEETLDRIGELVERGRTRGKSHQVVTINADFVVKAMGDPELRYLLQEADLATADGMPLVWGARLLGVSLESRVAGADLVPALAERAAQKGYKLYLLGAAPGIADRAAHILQERYPGLQIVGVCSPSYSSVLEMDTSVLDEIKAARPDILLVAFGNPKQEKWIGMYRRQLKVPVMIGIGGTLDLIAGDKKRAPLWMQRTGLEWLYRLIQEPGRLWRRYVVDLLVFGTFFSRQWWAMRQGRTPSMVLPSADLMLLDNKTAIMSLEGPLTIVNYQPFVNAGQEALATTPYILVNLSKTEFLDSAAIGALVGLAKQARDAGGDLALTGVPPDIQRTFSLLRLNDFFVVHPDVESGLLGLSKASQNGSWSPDIQEVKGLVAHSKAEWTVVKGPRRLDADSAPTVTDTCSSMLAQNPFLILDLSDTVFLASAGLAALAHLHRLADEKNGEFRVTNCSADVLRVIEMVRFDRVLSLYGDLSSAMA